MNRILPFHQAILEATDICLERDPRVYLMGLGVPDPRGIFGTTIGLQEKFGPGRVFDVPVSENGMTGIAIGSAITGYRPILTHQRFDFALLTMEQLVNQAAKWHYMFGGQASVPLVIRMVIGRGWGQGPQHSQALHAWFAHVPGLKVVMPATAADAKGLLISAVEDNNPVIFLEHRWLHAITGHVPEGHYTTPIGPARTVREGKDVTIAATSYMVLEAIRASEMLEENGIFAEILDMRTIAPLDLPRITASVEKTGRLAVADIGTKSFGIGAEIISTLTEINPAIFKAPPTRIALPDFPTPTSPALAAHYYPRAPHIADGVLRMFGKSGSQETLQCDSSLHYDVPDRSFKGPF